MKFSYGIVFSLMALSAAAVAKDVKGPVDLYKIAAAVNGTTVMVDGKKEYSSPNINQQAELVHALASSQMLVPSPTFDPGPICIYNCAPPTGRISASPSVVGAPAGGMGHVSIQWYWTEDPNKPLTEYSCLWVAGDGELNAHIVQCEHPGHTYTTDLNWIAAGHRYVFSVAPGNPYGPYTKSASSLLTLASTTVVGVVQ